MSSWFDHECQERGVSEVRETNVGVNSKDTDQTLDMDTSALWRIVVTTLLDFCSNYYIHGHYCRIIEFVYNYFHVSLVIN